MRLSPMWRTNARLWGMRGRRSRKRNHYELSIQTSVQTILDFPMASDRQRNPLDFGRQAADVVRARGTGALAHRSCTLGGDKAGRILPGAGLAELAGRVMRHTATHLDPSVAGALALVRRARRQWVDVGCDDQVAQRRGAVFRAQHVVGTTLMNGACNLGLCPHHINGDGAAVGVEHLEQLGNRRDLIVLFGGRRLAQHHARVGRKCAAHMQRRSVRFARDTSARLPVDRDDLVFVLRQDDAPHPDAKGLFELLRIGQQEYALEGVRRGHAIVEPKKTELTQSAPRLLRVAPVFEPLENLHQTASFPVSIDRPKRQESTQNNRLRRGTRRVVDCKSLFLVINNK